jgi:hypothetical protein
MNISYFLERYGPLKADVPSKELFCDASYGR